MTVAERPEARATRMRIVRRLAVERLMRGLAQRDVAEQLGSRQAEISAMEIGRRNPYLETAIAHAHVLGLDMAVVGPHHLSLLDLTGAEVDALIAAAGRGGADPALLAQLDAVGAGGVAAGP